MPKTTLANISEELEKDAHTQDIFKTKPLNHQLKAFNRFKDMPYAALFWQMGYGKTKTAIDFISYKYRKGCIDTVIVLAPGLVLKQWEDQLQTHCSVAYSFLLYRFSTVAQARKKLGQFMCKEGDGVKIIAISYDTCARASHFNEIWDMCATRKVYAILDEATRIKNVDALRTKALLYMRERFTEVLLLTGTAFAKRPSDIWSLYKFMDYRILNQPYTAFRQEYILLIPQTIYQKGVSKTVLTQLTEDKWQYFKNKLKAHNISEENTAALLQLAEKLEVKPSVLREVEKQETYYPFKNIDKLKRVIAPFTGFIEDSDNLNLEKIYKPIVFEPVPAIKKLLAELKKSALAQYQDTVMTVSSAMALQQKVLQIAGNHFIDIDNAIHAIEPNQKLAYILDFFETVDEQALIFAVYKAEISTLYNALTQAGVKSAVIAGGVQPSQRDSHIDAFKKGDIKALICHPAVAGYGMNLQNAHYQIWYSRLFDTEARVQAESRTLRYGSRCPTTYIDLMYDIGLERRVYAINRQAEHMNNAFNKDEGVYTQLTLEQIFEI